ncbi:MAG: YdcF family protein [Brevinematales bacterium]|nr:YdcF family protein [Brevinematales bacterium]
MKTDDKKQPAGARKIILRLTLILAVTVFAVFLTSLGVVQFYPASEDMNCTKELAVIFGAGIKKEGPSIALQMRLDKGLELYQQKKVRFFFISGTMYEVRSMKVYLIKHGVSQSNIIEDKMGVTTHETMENVKDYTIENNVNGIVFISQKYHIPRIVLFAGRSGITNAEFIAAERKEIRLKELWIYTLREALALVRAFILGY